MGFPDSFDIPVSDTQAYQQFGQAAVVPMISEIAFIMHPYTMTLASEKLLEEANDYQN